MKTLSLAFAGLVALAGVASADPSVEAVNQSVRDVQILKAPVFEGRNSAVGTITWSSTDGGTNDIYAVQQTGRALEGRNAAPARSAAEIVRDANRTLGH